jgi:hypothetical protein
MRTEATEGSAAARRASGVAKVVEFVSWNAVALSVVAGVILAATPRTTTSAFTSETTHPYVPLGVGVAVGGAFQALVVIMIAAYIQAKAPSPATSPSQRNARSMGHDVGYDISGWTGVQLGSVTTALTNSAVAWYRDGDELVVDSTAEALTDALVAGVTGEAPFDASMQSRLASAHR